MTYVNWVHTYCLSSRRVAAFYRIPVVRDGHADRIVLYYHDLSKNIQSWIDINFWARHDRLYKTVCRWPVKKENGDGSLAAFHRVRPVLNLFYL